MLLYNPGPITRELRKVRISQDRNSAEILANDDPEVCGYSILPDKTDVVGG